MSEFYVVAKGIMTRDGKLVVHNGGTYKVFDIDRMINAESPYVSYLFRPRNV